MRLHRFSFHVPGLDHLQLTTQKDRLAKPSASYGQGIPLVTINRTRTSLFLLEGGPGRCGRGVLAGPCIRKSYCKNDEAGGWGGLLW